MRRVTVIRCLGTTDHGLRAEFFKNIPSAQWTAIETAPVSIGVPDSEYAFSGGVTGWIEFKYARHWKFKFSSVEQIGWIARRARLGGRVWIAVKRGETELWMVPGSFVEQLADDGLQAVASQAHVFIKPWEWSQIQDLLDPPHK